MTEPYRLKLYVTGQTHRSESAIGNITRICNEILPDMFELEVVDILESPDVAELRNIVATPTLIKESPPPIRRIIGDMSDLDSLKRGLDLQSTNHSNRRGENKSE